MRGTAVEVEDDDVGAEAMDLPDDGARPILLADHLAALLGQHPMTREQARRVCELLELDERVAESLTLQPTRGTDPATMADPTIYRFVEALSVYGPALKELIHEEFGDGIMSAINFRVDFSRRPSPDGDRVVVTFDGKFLDYKW